MNLNNRIAKVVWGQWEGDPDTNNGVKPIWEMWKILHRSGLTPSATIPHMLYVLAREMDLHPDKQHFGIATGGLLLSVDRSHDGREANVELAVTSHHVGTTLNAY